MAILKTFQLLEVTIISAQDLEPKNTKMRTYATAWINPARKLTTVVDKDGGFNPTWNDKFVFRVDEEFLRRDTSAVEIEIYSVRWFRDFLIGTVRLLVGNLIPPPARPHHYQHFGMRFAAVQVRRPSGRPQGIINIGVAVLDSSMRSMPLYQLAQSAVGYRDLMEEDHLPLKNNHHGGDNDDENAPYPKPIFRRSTSDRSEFLGIDNISLSNSSVVAIPRKNDNKVVDDKESSILSISFYPPPPTKGKASLMINGVDLNDDAKRKDYKKGKASSVVSDSFVSKDLFSKFINKSEAKEKNKGIIDDDAKNGPQVVESPTKKPNTEVVVGGKPKDTSPLVVPKPNEFEYGGPIRGNNNNNKLVIGGGPYKANSILSDSEVGPSPSEVAAAMAERPRYPLDLESSVLDGWSLDESVEGLRSKLERWRSELPPLYDRGYASSSFRSTSQYTVRRRGEESGLFSCFGNIFGYECRCVCGAPPRNQGGNKGGRFQSPSSSVSYNGRMLIRSVVH